MDDQENWWTEQLSRDEGYNFVEFTKLPKKITSRSLISLIFSSSKVVPTTANICMKREDAGALEQVGLVKFKSERDAFIAINTLKSTPYGKLWQMKIIKEPSL